VLASYEKHGEDMAEDYKVVKSRMDMCVQLQKDNPMVYKLRADFLKVGATCLWAGACGLAPVGWRLWAGATCLWAGEELRGLAHLG